MHNNASFWTFTKKYWPLMIGLILLLITPIGIFCLIFKENLNDVSAWASMIAGIVTYIGTTVLSIAVFYNTWIQQHSEEMLIYEISVTDVYNGCAKNLFSIEDFPEEEKQFCYEFSDDIDVTKCAFKRIVIKNFNKLPIKVMPIKIELSIDNDNYKEYTKEASMITNFSLFESLEYKENGIILLGINEKLFDAWKKEDGFHFFNMNIIFDISNFKYNEYVKLNVCGENSSWQLQKLSKRESKKLSNPNTLNQILLYCANNENQSEQAGELK